MATSHPSHLRVAIIGGGLAGITLANALIRTPRLEVQVYEAAPSFSERGTALALGTNALRALEQIFPTCGKDSLLERAGAVPLNSVRSVLGSGSNAGETIFDSSGAEPDVIVHRASLLRELVAPLPRKCLHANKKLTAVKLISGTDSVELTFEDGTIDEFDAVIGADGIFSSVRSYVLGDDADKFAATPAGFWDCRNLVPVGKAKAVLGNELFAVDRQYGWVGNGGFLMHDVLENGTVVQCVISAVERLPTHERRCVLSREILTQTLDDWLDGPIAKGMIELLLEQDDLHGYSQWEHKATPSYVNGPVCVIGDAAHATTPWQGSGAAMAFEDAMILQDLLGNIRSPAEIGVAFKTYDVLRRPRCQRIVDSSRETGMILCGQDTSAGLHPEKLRQILAPKWDFIVDFDMSAHREDALWKLKEMLGGY